MRTGEALNIVTVFDVDNGISFSTEMGTGKRQEIQMVLNVLKTLNFKESIIPLNTLHFQTETVNEIVNENGSLFSKLKAINLYKFIECRRIQKRKK